MRVSMKKNLKLSVVAMTMLALSGSALANGTNLDVNFTANIRETTCDMKLVGGTGSDTQQTLTIGSNSQVRIDDVKAGTANANFKIVIVECPASLTSLKTTVKGSPSGYLTTGLVNQITKANGGADYSAVEIASGVNSTAAAELLIISPSIKAIKYKILFKTLT